MKQIVTAARRVQYDERTDVREYTAGEETEEGLAELTYCLESGDARLEPGLTGWQPFTATLFSEQYGVYHVATEERNEEPRPLVPYPSPCCGKESAWVNNYRRRCPCGKEWRV